MGTSTLQILVMGEDRASGGLKKVGGALGSFGDAATRAGTSLLPLSAGAGLVAGSALKMAADYEQSMNVLQASTEASAADMKALGDTAIALGADVKLPGTSAKDAADAMLELSKAGLSVTDTMAAARGVLLTSAAAQIGNAEAAEITANALNMFKLSGDQATMVADLLAAGANKSSADIRDMADALKMAGAVASMAGLSIQDTTTAIALMANQGIKGSDAGTSLKQMLLSLQAPTGKAKELMTALGISIFDANGSMLPMPALISQFGGALNGLSQEQRNAALATIFGSDAVRAANILLLGGTEAWNAMSGAVTQGGTAAMMAAAQNMGLKGALDGLKSTLETILLTGAQPFLGFLSQLVLRISDTVGAFALANPQIVQAGIAFAGVLAVAAPLVLGIGAVSTALGALLSPVGLVVLAVGALAAAWTTNLGGIRDVAATVLPVVQEWVTLTFAAIQLAVTSALEIVRLVVSEVMTFVQSFVTQAMTSTGQIWGSTWEAIRTTVETVLAAVLSIVTTVLSAVAGFIAAHGTEIMTALQTAWKTISEIINAVVLAVQLVVTTVFGAIAAFIMAHGEEIEALLTTAWTLISSMIQATLDAIKAVVTTVLSVLQTVIGEHGDEIQTVLTTVWTAIQAIIEATLSVIHAVVTTVLSAVSGFITAHGDEIAATLSLAWQTISEIISLVTAVIQQVVTTVFGAIASFIKAHGDDIQSVLTIVWTVIRTVIETTLQIIHGVVKTIMAALRGDWSVAWETIKNTTITIWENLNGAIGILGAELKKLVQNIWESVKATAVALWNEIKGAILSILDGLIGGVYEKGAALATRFGDGIRGALQRALDAARWLAQQLRDLLPGSDAKKGPLSDLGDAGRGLALRLAEGIRAGAGTAVAQVAALSGAMSDQIGMAMGQANLGVGGQGLGIGNLGAGSRGQAAAPQNITIQINNPVVREQADIRRLAAAVSEVFTQQAQVYRRVGV